jgi:hypothetical protein
MKFLNVDLEITAPESLQPIVESLGTAAIILYHDDHDDEYLLVLELNSDSEDKAIETTIATLCSLIETLPEPAQAHWQNATTRIFDIGYEADPDNQRLITEVSATALDRIAKLNATLRTTIYRDLEPTDDSSSAESHTP